MDTRIVTTQGDLTAMELDVVVNAANEDLAHGAGLAAAMARAGGRLVYEGSAKWVSDVGRVTAGAAVTSAGNMPARAIVHVVGPRYRGDGTDETALAKAVRSALHAAAGLGARTVGMPAISTGVFGYPLADATAVIAEAVTAWCAANPQIFDAVHLVGFDAASVAAFEAGLAALG